MTYHQNDDKIQTTLIILRWKGVTMKRIIETSLGEIVIGRMIDDNDFCISFDVIEMNDDLANLLKKESDKKLASMNIQEYGYEKVEDINMTYRDSWISFDLANDGTGIRCTTITPVFVDETERLETCEPIPLEFSDDELIEVENMLVSNIVLAFFGKVWKKCRKDRFIK